MGLSGFPDNIPRPRVAHMTNTLFNPTADAQTLGGEIAAFFADNGSSSCTCVGKISRKSQNKTAPERPSN